MSSLFRSSAFFLCFSTVAALPLSHVSYGHSGVKNDYGSNAAHHSNSFYDAAHGGHNAGAAAYYSGHKDTDHSATSKAAAGAAYESEAHGADAGNKYNSANSDFGKDVKSKSFGFFDYKFVQPQYHIEQFHSNEKHAQKYGADAHSEGAKQEYGNGFHNKGYEGYDKAHQVYDGEQSGYNGKNAAEGHKFSDYNNRYDDSADGQFDKGYEGYSGKYGDRYEVVRPHYEGYGSHGYGGKPQDYAFSPFY